MAKVTKTKDAVCIQCGEVIQINVLASLKTAKCEICKTDNKSYKKLDTEATTVSTAYGESMSGPRIDGKPNKALRNLDCPYCQTKMNIIGVIKNDHWGDIVSFQCRTKGCYTMCQISEQSHKMGPMRTTVDGTSFEIDDVIDHLREGKMSEWCEARDIEQKRTIGL